MKKLILSFVLLITATSFGEVKDTSFRLPNKKDFVNYLKTESTKHILDALKKTNIAAIIESGCYDVIFSSDSKGNIKYQLKERQ